jgi:hypothetical protein
MTHLTSTLQLQQSECHNAIEIKITCYILSHGLEYSGTLWIRKRRSIRSAMQGDLKDDSAEDADDPNLTEKNIDTCTTCHKDNNRKARAKQLQEWQAEYKEKMDALQADVNSISAALKEKPDLLNADMKKKFGDVRFNLSILTRDSSKSAHNSDHALDIMALASSDLKELKAAVK